VSGQGRLRIVRSGDQSVVHTARATSPLKFLLPRNHGAGAWAFVTNLGGGLVDGDAIDVELDVGPGAVALLGTQSATKVYRSPQGTRQSLRGRVGEDALLVVPSDPVLCFAGARYLQTVELELARGASVVFVDGLLAGREARGERWAFARYESRVRVRREGKLFLHDALLLDPAHGSVAARMGRFGAVVTVLAVGPAAVAVRERALAMAQRPQAGAAEVFSAAPVADDAILGRVAGPSAASAAAFVRALLAPVTLRLGDDPFERKW